MRDRRQKRCRVNREKAESALLKQQEEQASKKHNNSAAAKVACLEQERKRPPPVVRNKIRDKNRINPGTMGRGDVAREMEDAAFEAQLPFCCAICHCSKAVLEQIDPTDAFVASSDDTLFHRRCCHGALDPNDIEWAPPFEAIVENVLFQEVKRESELEWVSQKEIANSYETAKRQEAALYNADGETHPLDRLRTHEDYGAAIEERFTKIRDSHDKKSAVVLDAFAGVGTGIVVLKRLGIVMSKVIHVEYDKVASHVYKHNHDAEYNPNVIKDNVQHVYDYPTWEALVGDEMEKLKAFYEKHGPIDIVLGGPPCVDYSLVNANRQGSEGQQGQYMVRFGQAIRYLERLQHPHPLFFLAENVYLQGDNRLAVSQAFGLGWDPIALDAQYLSPARRNRHFFTNTPLSDLDFVQEDSHVGPRCCLEDGFVVPAHLVEKDNELTAKARLMASKSRIDERSTLRMYVFAENSQERGRYHGRPMKVQERELLMGYPKGYVEEPVQELFQVLVNKGLCMHRRADIEADPQLPWHQVLPEKYHHFAGNYHHLPEKDSYRFHVVNNTYANAGPLGRIGLLMAPPVPENRSTVPFFNHVDYAKHLIGNAYSVPVVQELLKPLCEIFERREYSNYDYKFAWQDDVGIYANLNGDADEIFV